MMQLSTEDSVLLFQFRYIDQGKTTSIQIPKESMLGKILVDDAVLKIGIALSHDDYGLNEILGLELNGMVEMQGPLGRGFSDLCSNILHLGINKDKLTWVRSSGWEQALDAESIGYAAADSWIPLIMYTMLTNRYDRTMARNYSNNIYLPREIQVVPDSSLERWRSSYNNVSRLNKNSNKTRNCIHSTE